MQTRNYQNIRRLHKIVAMLIKYGFGGVVKELKLFPFLASLERVLFFRRTKKELSIPERIRLVLEGLGPTFIKLGQVASTSANLLPPAWVLELQKLQYCVL